MNRKSLLLLSTASILSVGILGIFAAKSAAAYTVKADLPTYTFENILPSSFRKEGAVLVSDVVSNTGHGFSSLMAAGATFENNALAYIAGGTLVNETGITGIKSIAIRYEGEATAKFGPTKLSLEGAIGQNLVSGRELSVDSTSAKYFQIDFQPGTKLLSVSIFYTCIPLTGDYVDLVDYEVVLPGEVKAGDGVYLVGKWNGFAPSADYVLAPTDKEGVYVYTGAALEIGSGYNLAVGREGSYSFAYEESQYFDTANLVNDTIVFSKPFDLRALTFENYEFAPVFMPVSFDDSLDYTSDNNNVLVKHNDIDEGNFLLKDEKLPSHYMVEATILGTKDLPLASGTSVKSGFVLSYKDEGNYLLAFAEWKANGLDGYNRPLEMAAITIHGKHGGELLDYQSIWCDGVAVSPSDGLTIKVDCVDNGDGSFSITGFVNGSQKATVSYSGLTGLAGASKYGLFAKGDEMSFTDIKVEEVVEEEFTVISAGTGMTDFEVKGDGSVVVENYNWKAGFVAKKADGISFPYTLSAHIAGTTTTSSHGELMYGFLAYYRDANNFIIAYVQYAGNDRPHEMREIQITGNLGGADIGWYDIWTDGNNTLPATGFDLEVTVSSPSKGLTSVSATVRTGTYTKSGVRTIAQELDAPSYLGLYAQGEPTTYTNFVIS